MKKLMLVFVMLFALVLVSACAPTAPARVAPVADSCDLAEAISYLEDVSAISDVIDDELAKISNSSGYSEGSVHIARATNKLEDLYSYTNSANPPQCLEKFNQYTNQYAYYLQKGIDIGNPDWKNDLDTAMEYLDKSVSELNKINAQLE